MPTLISKIAPRPSATIEFTAEELDMLLDICSRIGGPNEVGTVHYFTEQQLLPLLIQAGAEEKSFETESNSSTIYYI